MISGMKRGQFFFLWFAIIFLFAAFGAFGSEFSEASSGAVCWGALGFCVATCGVVGLAMILKVRAQRLTKWVAVLIILGCSAASALIPPVLMGLTGLFHGESGLVIYFEAVLGFWIAIGSLLICTVVLLCLRTEAGALIRVPRSLIIGAAAIVVATLVLSPMKVGKRITSIDLSRLYLKIDDYYEGRKGYVQRTGAYPSNGGGDYYHFPTTNGSVTIRCTLDDFDGRMGYFRKEKKAETSQPIGEQAFFGDWRHGADKDLELAYRRLNVSAIFGFSASKPNVIATGEYKVDLETSAKILDQAILDEDPCIQSEDVQLGQVVGWKVKQLPNFVFRFYSLFSPKSGW